MSRRRILPPAEEALLALMLEEREHLLRQLAAVSIKALGARFRCSRQTVMRSATRVHALRVARVPEMDKKDQ